MRRLSICCFLAAALHTVCNREWGGQISMTSTVAPETTVPVPEGTEYVDPGEEVPDITSKKPIIVIALVCLIWECN
jgi:hypothetical protein